MSYSDHLHGAMRNGRGFFKSSETFRARMLTFQEERLSTVFGGYFHSVTTRDMSGGPGDSAKGELPDRLL